MKRRHKFIILGLIVFLCVASVFVGFKYFFGKERASFELKRLGNSHYMTNGHDIFVESNTSHIGTATLRRIIEADTGSFRLLDGDGTAKYAVDRNAVYVDGLVIPGADPMTFHYLFPCAFTMSITADQNHVYFGTKILQRYSTTAPPGRDFCAGDN